MEANTPTTSLTPRTAREWFEMLPEPYRTQAIENTKEQFPEKLNSNFDDIEDAVCLSFQWSSSKQGREYWGRFHTKLLQNKIQLTEPKKDAAEQQMQEAESKPTLRPRRDWLHERVQEIVGAISLQLAACEPIPVEWVEELNDHVFELWSPLSEMVNSENKKQSNETEAK